MHGGLAKTELGNEDLVALEKGLPNLLKHVENMQNLFGIPCVVAINKFPLDTEAELKLIEDKCKELGVNVVLSDVWAKGGEGAVDLANEVVRLAENSKPINQIYDIEDSLEEKLNKIVQKVYGGLGVTFSPGVKKKIKTIEELGYKNVPICMAKTQYSFSDDKNKVGRPEGFKVNIKDIKIAAGAGFAVAYSGDIMTMPGLPKVPAANNIDITDDGKIVGLF